MPAIRKAPLLSRPRDDSIQAYKDWILEFYRFLTGSTDPDGGLTEEQWIKSHREFWSGEADPAGEEGDVNA